MLAIDDRSKPAPPHCVTPEAPVELRIGGGITPPDEEMLPTIPVDEVRLPRIPVDDVILPRIPVDDVILPRIPVDDVILPRIPVDEVMLPMIPVELVTLINGDEEVKFTTRPLEKICCGPELDEEVAFGAPVLD